MLCKMTDRFKGSLYVEKGLFHAAYYYILVFFKNKTMYKQAF